MGGARSWRSYLCLPDLALTQAPYAYAGGNPVINTDTTGLTLESHNCKESSGGFKVNVCIQTWAITLHGQWFAQTTFKPDKNIIETGAKAIGMNVCNAHRRHCNHGVEQVNRPRAQWVMQCIKATCHNNPPWLATPSALAPPRPSSTIVVARHMPIFRWL